MPTSENPITFPLCADPVRDQKMRSIVERSLSLLIRELGGRRLQAVILTGSLARGEGSVLLRPATFRLLGDVEFLVILRTPFEWGKTRRYMLELGRQATCELGDDGRVASIEYGPASLAYLKQKIRPCIFAYDLTRHGKVVWGDRDILAAVKPFDVEQIPPEDAVTLIMNRIVELLLVEAAQSSNGADREDLAYHLVKILLDLAGSALAFTGRYVSLYTERQRGFASALGSVPDLRSALPRVGEFESELKRAIDCKLAPTDELLFEGEATARLAAVSAWARALWQWEMQRLLRLPGGQFPDLLHGYLTHESFYRRLKGWAKFYLHPLRPRGTFDAGKFAAFLLRASPHTLTYAAALLAYWAESGDGQAVWQAQARRLLPVPVAADGAGATVGEIGNLWCWLIRNN